MNIEVREILSERKYAAGYVVRTELWEHGDDEPTKIKAAYTPNGDYIGNPVWAYRLCKTRGLKPEKTSENHCVCSVGFCEKDQKWYGWSHRAIYGFGIGSEVKRGDCAYVGATPEDLIDDRAAFFSDINQESMKLHRQECQILDDRSGIRILHAPLIIPMANSIEEAFDDDAELEEIDIHKDAVSIVRCGHGEWRAETFDDAKQMACDFAESVS